MQKKHLILACDGGGIRGLLTAYILKELDKQTEFLKRVDLFAGTSTGGILAIGLAGNVKIDKLIELYKDNAQRIFTAPENGLTDNLVERGLKTLVRTVKEYTKGNLPDPAPMRFVKVKYQNRGLREAIQNVFPGNPLLSGLERKVLVTTFRLAPPDSHWLPVALHNLKIDGETPIKSHVVESAMCTSAAPTYFEPYKHDELGYCIDGGVFANNPGSLAVTYSCKAGIPLNQVVLLSVGTGLVTSRYPLEDMKLTPQYMGALAWAWPVGNKELKTPDTPILSAIMDGASALDSLICQGLLQKSYFRLQPKLSEVIEMDDFGALDKLQEIAVAQTKTPEWKAAIEWLKQQIS